MTPRETGMLLAMVAASDRRTVGDVDIEVWHAALADLDFGECRVTVLEHCRSSTDWLMPAMVRRSVRAARADRLARQLDLPPDADPDDTVAYREALRARRVLVAGPVAPRDMTAIEGVFPPVPAADVPEWNRVREDLARRAPRPVDLTYGESMRELQQRFPAPAPADAAGGEEPDPGGLAGAYAADDELVASDGGGSS